MEFFEKGTLWDTVTRAREVALATGELLPISTAISYLEQAGVEFPVRRILAIKERSTTANDGHATRPFLIPDSALRVADVSPTHVCLLNKFPVFNNHLLIVTRNYEAQDAPLNLHDFCALWPCMAEYEALCFYNAGALAGASQQHKHLQMVPLPLAPRGLDIPIQPLLNLPAMPTTIIGTSPLLPFPHRLARLPPQVCNSTADAADLTHGLYRNMLLELGLNPALTPLGAYNVLLTRNWMLLVPRSRERFDTLSINALAFAGHFLVRDETEMETLKKYGPLAVLRQVAANRPAESQDFPSQSPGSEKPL